MPDIDQTVAAYRVELGKYEEVLDATMRCSLHQHGIQTDGRGIRAVKIFTRQTVVGISLKRILPLTSDPRGQANEFCDVCSVASLTRNLLEGYAMLFYAGLEQVNDEEAEFRFLLGQYHRNRAWRDIRDKFNPQDPGLQVFREGLPQQLTNIKAHAFFSKLSREQQAAIASRGKETYLSHADLEQRAPVVGQYQLYHQLLSNLVHPLPLSIERIDNDCGRGVLSDADMQHCLICVSLATRFLLISTAGIVDLFSAHFDSGMHERMDKIRGYLQGT